MTSRPEREQDEHKAKEEKESRVTPELTVRLKPRVEEGEPLAHRSQGEILRSPQRVRDEQGIARTDPQGEQKRERREEGHRREPAEDEFAEGLWRQDEKQPNRGAQSEKHVIGRDERQPCQ